ncbi:MAG: xanthine dehydrogenase family protein molybdopterin-binding subunit [Alphaproteobacteria bacterium]|nr:xanthine dehydrogenase family protein molybdopterin-binding subunit [Alphaproteobacteria bacterium]
MGRFGVGQSVRRTEDPRLLTGRGRYTDDVSLPGQVFGFVLRAPMAHAEIRALDASAAEAAPGVLAVLTGEHCAADGLGNIPCPVEMQNRDGSPIVKPPRPVLAQGRVRFVGDPVAFVVAETLDQARDAAELIAVDYEDLPAVTGTAEAAEPGAPQVWDQAPGNICLEFEAGDRGAADAGFAKAAHVARLTLINNRVAPAPLEPRAALGAYDPTAERYTLYTPSQGVHTIRSLLAGQVLKVAKDRLHVITGDVGGGFGLKIFLYPEQALVAWAARRVGRPVKWTADRSEGFLGDIHGRDHVTEAALALDGEGRFLALKVSTIANLGAYLSNYGPFIPSAAGIGMLCGSYTLPAVHAEVRGVFSNTCPLDAYRGAGRPEANYVIERIIDTAAHELGLSPAELRRRNFISPEAMPFTTALDLTYDSGAFERNMEDALRAADWDGFEARRQEARRNGRLRGIGMSSYIEVCGGMPNEKATVRFKDDRTVELLIGSQSNGQGHETAYAQLLADRLGVDIDRIHVVQGDSDAIDYGSGTGGSRAVSVGGSAVHRASEQIIDQGREIAAHMLEAAPADIEFGEGRFTIAGTDRTLTIDEVAAAAGDPAKLPDGMEPGLEGAVLHDPAGNTFPNGCHVCELEIDPETGETTIQNYVVVDDFGVVINPMLLEGQVHGGVAQGVGQALMELCVYEAESGQLLTGSFMDYCMPRADDLPKIDFAYNEVPCANNPLGVKGSGEAGAIGAPPAVINAVVDALSPMGIKTIDMPATPARVWQAIQNATLKEVAA